MAGISVGSVSISVVPSAEGFSDQLKATLVPEADAIGVEVGQHISDGIKEQLKDITVTVTADTAAADAALDELSRKNVTPSVTFDDSGIVAALEGISAKLDELNDTVADIRVTLEDTGVNDQLDEIIAKLDEINDKNVSVKPTIDQDEFDAQIAEMQAKLDALQSEGGGSEGGLLESIPGGGITAGIGAVAAASPSLPGALTGAASGLGTLGLAYEGISGALSDYSDQTTSATSATKESGSTALSASNQIRTAQQAVSAAQTTASHDATTSAEAIKTAQQGVAQAVQQAAQNQVSAEQQLQTAEYNEQQAQISLTQARQQAVLTLQQLNDASADAVLDAKQAALDLQQAQVNQQTTDASSTSTALEKAQAALAVQEAQQRLIEANQNETNSAKAATTANKEGVNGLPAVVSAEHSVATAKQATANAQTNLKNVTQSGAESIAKAQQTLADASRSASWQQQADAKSIANAQANLKYAYASAAAAGKSSATATTNSFQQAMSQLSPVQQSMVKEIIGFENALKGMEGTADKAIAPGLSTFLKGLDELIPVITPEVSQMGKIIGGFMSDMGKDMGTSSFQKMLETLFTEGNKFVQIVGPALGNLITSFMEMGAKSAPAVTGLAQGLAGIADGFSGMFKALAPSAGAIGKTLADIGKIVDMIGPPIGALLGGIVTAAEPIITALLPPLQIMLTALTPVLQTLGQTLGQVFGQAMKALAPLMEATAKQTAQLLTALVPLIPPLGTLIDLTLKLTMDALGPLITATIKFDGFMTDMEVAIIKVVTAVVKWLDVVDNIKQVFNDVTQFLSSDFVPAIVNFFTKSIPAALDSAVNLYKTVFVTPWEDGLKDVVNFVGSDFVQPIGNFFTKTLPGYWTSSIGFLKSTFVTPFQNALKGAWTWVTTNVWDPLKTFMTSTLPGYFTTAVSAINAAFSKLENVIETPVKFVVNNVIDRLISAFDWVSTKVGGPNIQPFKFATGGMVPGGYGGGDVVPALLEPGEAVVNKVTTRAHAAELSEWGVPGFANGGIAGDPSMAGRAAQVAGPSSTGNSGAALGPLSGAIGKIEDAVGIMSALATGNGTALTNDLMKTIGSGTGGAVADLASTLSGVTKTLVKSAVSTLLGLGGGGGLDGNGSAIVKYAESFIGKLPYVWGGTSLTTGADCCIIGSMRVQTVRGPVEIRNIRAGDEVYTWNDGKLSVNRVAWRSEPRYQQTYRLRTIHREIIASGNHPFLTLRKAGRCAAPEPRFPEREKLARPRNRRERVAVDSGEVQALYLAGASLSEVADVLGCSIGTVVNRLKETGTQRRPVGGQTTGRPAHTMRDEWALSWVNLEDLRRDDIIVTLKSLPDEAPVPDDPYLSDERFLWLLGLAFGDGTLSTARANRVTLCVFDALRDELQDRLEDYCGKRGSHSATNGLRVHSELLATGLRRFGMDAKSVDRVPPRELWTLPHRLIQAFLDGYTAADGHRVKRASDPALSYKAANRALVEDVRNLHMVLGHNVTRVRELKRTRPIVIRGKEVQNARSLWTFEAYETGGKLINAAAGLLKSVGIADLFPEDSHFRPQKITSIEPMEVEDTYDITVEDTHNFVAEGLVVHNSGFVQAVYKHFGIDAPRTSEEQWSWVKKGSPTPGGLAFFSGADGTASDPGHVGIVINSNKMVDAYTSGTDVMTNAIQGSSGTVSGFGTPPGGLGSSAAKGNLIANASTIGAYLLSHGANKIAAAAIMGNMLQESGGNWDIGGGGLIQITGAKPTSLADSLSQTISYINANGGMGPINAEKSVAAATQLFMSKYERPAIATENLARRLSGAQAAYAAGYDEGGWLPPGNTLTINGTGRPEPVFTGSQWDTLSAAVGGGTGIGARSTDKHLRRIGDLLEAAPARTGAHVGNALNGVARGSVQRAYSSTR